MLRPSDPWPPDLIEALPETDPPLYFYEEVDSTNDVALALAASGAPEGTAVLADRQRAGRGRRGRSWWSPPGAGMYLSVIVRADGIGDRVPLLTLAAGVALADAVTGTTGLPVELKWPNDVVIGRPWRKLAGILCEASSLGAPEGAVVVGLGLNLLRSAFPPEIADRATSLDLECSHAVSRGAIVAACLRHLRLQVARLRRGDAMLVLDQWRTLGRAGLDREPVRWHDGPSPRRGTVVGLGDDGALVVRPADGGPGSHDARLVAGEVVWERLSRG